MANRYLNRAKTHTRTSYVLCVLDFIEHTHTRTHNAWITLTLTIYTGENQCVFRMFFFSGGNTSKTQSENIGFESCCQRRLLRTPSWKMLVSLEALPCDTSDMGEGPIDQWGKGSWIPRMAFFRCGNQIKHVFGLSNLWPKTRPNC